MKKSASLLIALLMMLSVVTPVLAEDLETQPLGLIQMKPTDGQGLEGTTGEISLTFNQPIQVFDRNEEWEIGLRYDSTGDGEADSPVGDEYYSDVLEVSSDDSKKVIVNINNLLEENQTYSVQVNSLISVQGSTETDPSVSDQVYKPIGANTPEWTFNTNVEAKALELVEMIPEDKGSLGGRTEEIGLIFNQDVEVFDRGGEPQVGLRYDSTGDGYADTPVGAEYYFDVLEVSSEDSKKVIVKINDFLEDDKIYTIQVNSLIRVKGSEEIDPSASDQVYKFIGFGTPEWTFDTKSETLQVVCPIDGKTIEPEDEIFIKVSQDVDEAYVNALNIYLYEDDELITEGSGAELAELDDEDKKKIVIKLEDKLEIGHAYKVKVSSGQSGSPQDLITFDFNVDALGEYGLKIKLDFLRRESVNIGMQDFIAASMNNGVVYALRNNFSRYKGEENDEMGIRIYAFDLYGHELWNTIIEDIFTTNSSYMPVYGEDGTIYIQTRINDYNSSEFITQLFAIDPNDGSIKWKKEISERGLHRTSPIIIDEQIIVTGEKGLYSYDKDGSCQWNYTINNNGLARDLEAYRIEKPPIKDKDGNIYIAVKGKNTDVKDGKIQVLNPDGSEKWSYITGDGVLTPVIDSNGKVYVIDNTCIIRVLNSSDGSIITDHALNNYVIKPEQYDYNIVSINMGTDNSIYAVVEGFNSRGERVEGNKIIAINSDGTEKYIYKKDDHVIGELVIDHEGYAYYSEYIDGGTALYAVDPYGDKAAEILPVGSTLPEYNSIYIDGSVLIGAKDYSTNVIGVKIERRLFEQPASIEIIEKDKSLGVNLEETLAVAVRNTDGKAMIGEELEWISSDDSIVEALQDGSLICKKEGAVTLTVKVKGRDISDSTRVEVIEKPPKPASIEILDENGEVITDRLTIGYGTPYQFQVRVLDQYGVSMEDEDVIWLSIINYFPAIDHNGLLNPKAEGTYSLEVISCTDVRVTDKITYDIEKKPSIYSYIFPKEAVMTFPGAMTLAAVDQYGKTIKLEDMEWSSSDENKVSVNNKGELTAKDYGTAIVTGTSNGAAHSREISVVPPFGYEWNIESSVLRPYMDEGKDGAFYYIDNTNELVSLNSLHKTENWRLELGSFFSYMEAEEDGNIYCVLRDTTGKYKISAINPDKTIKWEYDIENYVGSLIDNIEQSSDGTIYLASSQNNLSYLYAVDKDGNKKWQIEFDRKVYSFILDNEDNIICVTNDAEGSVVTKIRDEADKGTIIEENILEDLFFGKGNIEVDDNGVVYGHFIDEQDKLGVCAVKNGAVKWKYYDIDVNILTDASQITLSDEGMLYFILGNNEGHDNYSLYKINNQGNEIWKKRINDLTLTNDNYSLLLEGTFTVDGDGDIYIPASEVKVENFSEKLIKSKVFKVDTDGRIVQCIGYDGDKYGDLKYIYLGNNMDSIYTIGSRRGGGAMHLVKLALESNQEIEVDEIKITAYKNSIIEGDSLQLDAKVYSQFGSVMTGEEVIWSSENADIVTVDDNGLVEGIQSGQSNIVAQSLTNPEIKGTFTITVVEADEHYVSRDKINEKTQLAVDYYKEKGMPQGAWIAFGLSAAGEDIGSDPYLSNGKSYIDNLWDTISAKDDLGEITEYQKIVMGILAGGYDPHNFGGMNLIERIYDYGSLGQGNNAAVWALIALDAANAQVPEGKGYFTQEFLIDYLLTNKTEAGWSISGDDIDIDLTGMVLYSLAPYKDRPDVKEEVDKAVEWLKTQQNENGSFNCFESNETNTESTAQVIMGLTALEIDPQGDDFIRGEGNPVSAMLANQLPDGSFEHIKNTGSNKMATEQALQALAALKQFNEKGRSTIFYHIPYDSNMGTVNIRIEGEEQTILPKTQVTIALGETNLLDAIKSALDIGDIDYEVENEEIRTISGEEGWKWIVNNNSDTYTLSSVLQGGEIIILHDDAITDPVVTRLTADKINVEVGEEVTAVLEKYDTSQEAYIPAANQEISFDGEVKASDSNGTVIFTALKEGSHYISSETKNDLIRPIPVLIEISDPNNSEPNPIIVERIAIDSVNTSLKVGNKPLLGARAFDSNNKEITGQNIIWSSSNPEVIKIDNDVEGKLIALKEGSAVITASLKNNDGIQDSITFTVMPNTREVYIRIEGYDHTVLPRTKINVPLFDLTNYLRESSGSSGAPSDGWGVDKFNNPTNAHAVVHALENKGVSYDFQDYGWSIYMAMIDGDREFDQGPTSGWLFKVNDSNPSIGADSVELHDGDDILWYYGAYGSQTVYTKLDIENTLVRIGEEVNIKLDGSGKSVEGSIILVNGSPYEINEQIVKVDSDGNAVLVFDEKGSYQISATRYRNGEGKIDIVRPMPVIIQVTDENEIDREPPVIIANGLVSNMFVVEDNISFSIEVTDNKDEEIVPVVRLNGIEIFESEGSYNIKLNKGENIVELEAVDESGNTAISVFKIAYEPVEIIQEIIGGLDEVDIPVDNQEELSKDQETVYVLERQEKMTHEESEELEKELKENQVEMEQEVDGIQASHMADQRGEVKLIFPADALKNSVKIKVEEKVNNDQTGEEIISSIYEFGPAGTEFEKPIFVRLKIPVANIEESNLALAWFNEEKGRWIPIPAVINPETGEITGQAKHFTKFAVIDKTLLPKIYASRIGSEAFKNGEEAKLKVNVMNNDDIDRKVTLIMVLWDKENNISKWTSVSKIIDKGQLEELEAGFTIPETGEYEVKVMIWDDMESIRALTPPIKIDVER